MSQISIQGEQSTSSEITALTNLAALAASEAGQFIRKTGILTFENSAAGGGTGDMMLASVQTNSGIKTFLNSTMKLRNVANTFDGYFVNTNTADRVYTLPDRTLTIDNITTSSTTNGTGFIKGNGSVISFDNSTYLTSVGTGTINELTYWSGANTLGTLAVATYPSLTELSYVNGVSSAIQTQLDGKQASMGADDNYVSDAQLVVIGNTSGTNTGDNSANSLYSGLATSKADVGQTHYIGTTQVAINRASAALTLAGITLTTPDIGTPSAGTLTNCTFPTLNQNTSGTSAGLSGTPSITVATITTTGSIELGHASDTTITRVSAGLVSIEGINITTISGTQSLSNKTFTGATVQSGYIDLDIPASDHTATGNTTNAIQSGYTASAFDLVFLSSGGKWLEVDADAVATCNGLLGISLEAKNDSQAMLVALPGSFVRDDTWAWTVGATLYAGETLGAIQEAIPTGADAIIKVIGFAVSADVIFFNPSPDQQSVVA